MTDDQDRYGAITRLLHWGMALLLAWQFAGMAVKLIVGRAPITAFWVGTHVSVGTSLMVLIVLRQAWSLLVLIAGHLGMVLIHRFVWRDGIPARMLG